MVTTVPSLPISWFHNVETHLNPQKCANLGDGYPACHPILDIGDQKKELLLQLE
jgi:hypothetical protein